MHHMVTIFKDLVTLKIFDNIHSENGRDPLFTTCTLSV